jgi:cytochrome c-type biogenesis protein CcmH
MTMLWLIFATLTFVILMILIFPLLKKTSGESMARVDYDIVVYRNQLGEIAQEVERGLLSESQADAARAEIHRRMLAAEDADLKKLPMRKNRRLQLAAIAVILVTVPAGAGTVYGLLGSPKLPGQPYAWRLAHDPQFVSASSADTLKAQLQANPSAAGYKTLAGLYFSSGNYTEAAAADQRAIELGSTDAATWSELGEATVMANGGAVVPDAMAAFTKALSADSRSERARFYMGLAEAQIGNLKRAVAIWRDLEKSSDAGAPWMPMVREHIAFFAKQGGFDPASVEPSPPSAAAMTEALSAMTGALQAKAPPGPAATPGMDQDTMIQGMVAKLAAEMLKNPGDADGWRRLANAYNVLHELDKAREAIGHAVQLQPRNEDVLVTLAQIQMAGTAPGNGAPQDSMATMHKILELDQENPTALYYVGLEEQKNGRQEQARAMWNRALAKVAPDDPLASSIRDQISLLPKAAKSR